MSDDRLSRLMGTVVSFGTNHEPQSRTRPQWPPISKAGGPTLSNAGQRLAISQPLCTANLFTIDVELRLRLYDENVAAPALGRFQVIDNRRLVEYLTIGGIAEAFLAPVKATLVPWICAGGRRGSGPM